MNQIFARLVWAERILLYLNPAQIPIDVPSEENHDDDVLEDDVEQDLLDIDTLKKDVLNEGSDAMLRGKFLDWLGEIFSHTRGSKHVTCVSLEEGDKGNIVRIAKNDSKFATTARMRCISARLSNSWLVSVA